MSNDLLFSFAVPLVVTAEDADEGLNAELRYEVVAGPASANFSVDPVSGTVRPTGPLDFELVEITGDPSDRVMQLTIRNIKLFMHIT